MELKPIGIIISPYKEKGDAPRQGRLSKENMQLVIDGEFLQGMSGLEGIEHIIVLYWGDRANRETLMTKPPGRDDITGVFSCRSPNRPNPIALCVAKIDKIEGNVIHVVGLDALDGSPLLDIKPYVEMIDGVGGETS